MAVIVRAPIGDGATAGTLTGTAGTRWQSLNDHPDSTGTSVIDITSAVGGGAAFTFDNPGIPAGSTVTLVRVRMIARKTGIASANFRGNLIVGGTNYAGSGIIPFNQAFTEHADLWDINPQTGLPWTVEDVNGTGPNPLQFFGFGSSDSLPATSFASIQLEIEYTPPSGLLDILDSVSSNNTTLVSRGDTGSEVPKLSTLGELSINIGDVGLVLDILDNQSITDDILFITGSSGVITLEGSSNSNVITASTGNIVQIHTVAGSLVDVIPNVAISGEALVTVHLSAGYDQISNSTATGTVAQTYLISSDTTSITNTTTVGVIEQVHNIVSDVNYIVNTAQSTIVDQIHQLISDIDMLGSVSASDVVNQVHILGSDTSSSINNYSDVGDIISGTILVGDNSTLNNTASNGSITQEHKLNSTSADIIYTSYEASINQLQELLGSQSNIVNSTNSAQVSLTYNLESSFSDLLGKVTEIGSILQIYTTISVGNNIVYNDSTSGSVQQDVILAGDTSVVNNISYSGIVSQVVTTLAAQTDYITKFSSSGFLTPPAYIPSLRVYISLDRDVFINKSNVDVVFMKQNSDNKYIRAVNDVTFITSGRDAYYVLGSKDNLFSISNKDNIYPTVSRIFNYSTPSRTGT